MPHVGLTGHLICADPVEAAVVRQHLPAHVELTRAELGCLLFDVTATDDPLVWRVEELFTDEPSFRAHQRRVAESKWGRVTSGIKRHYEVQGVTP